MTKNRQLRRKLKKELEREDIQSTGSFRTNFVNLRMKIRSMLERPAPYLELNQKLVEQRIAEHGTLAQEHLRLRG